MPHSQRKAAPPVRWENIDRRVLMRVLGCFDDKNTLRQAWRCLRLVNRHWCSTISGTLRFVRPNYMRLALQDVIEACVTHFSNAVEVDLSNCDLSSGVAQAFGCLVVLPKMRKLSLQGTEYDNSLISKLTSITTLTSLSLRRTSVTHSGLLPLGCLQKLSSLDVSGSKGVTDAGVQCFSSLSQLTSLTLDDCDSITDEGLGHLGLLTALRTLSLNGVWRVSHKGASAFCELRNLTGLHVADRRKRGLWGITDSCTDSISCLDKLRRLHLPPSMSGDGLQQLSCLKHLSSLKWFLQEVLDEDLAVLQSFSSLLSLSLSNASMALSSRMLSDCGLQHLVQVHFLTRLEIRGAHWITAKGIDSLSCMQSLKTLRINHCHRVTAPGFAFVTHLQLLQELDLAGCFALGDDVFKHLSGIVMDAFEALLVFSVNLTGISVSVLSQDTNPM